MRSDQLVAPGGVDVTHRRRLVTAAGDQTSGVPRGAAVSTITAPPVDGALVDTALIDTTLQNPQTSPDSPEHVPPVPSTDERSQTFRNHHHLLKLTMVCGDLVAMAAAILTASVVVDIDIDIRGEGLLSFVALASFVIVMSQQGLYNARHLSRRAEEIRRLVNAVALCAITVAAAATVMDSRADKNWIVAVATFSLVYTGVFREVVRRVVRQRRISGKMRRRVVLVGSNGEADELHQMLADHSELGYEVVGRVGDETSGPSDRSAVTEPEFAPWLGGTDEILQIVRDTGSSGVIVATTAIDLETANRLVRTLTSEGIYVEMSAAMRDIATRRVTVRPLGRHPVLTVEPIESNGWRSALKRTFDIALSALALLVLSPVLAVSAFAIRVTSGPGVFFRQTRVGKSGRQFTVFKLRTMVHDAEALQEKLWEHNEAAGPMFKMTNDPRVTPVGQLLRRTSIDELPQLLNVLRGEMSLVGPRPALPSEALQWNDELRERLRVKPGITGNWQVNGRFTTSIEDYQRLDMFYVDNWSIVTDLVILAKTVPAVLKRNGAA